MPFVSDRNYFSFQCISRYKEYDRSHHSIHCLLDTISYREDIGI